MVVYFLDDFKSVVYKNVVSIYIFILLFLVVFEGFKNIYFCIISFFFKSITK